MKKTIASIATALVLVLCVATPAYAKRKPPPPPPPTPTCSSTLSQTTPCQDADTSDATNPPYPGPCYDIRGGDVGITSTGTVTSSMSVEGATCAAATYQFVLSSADGTTPLGFTLSSSTTPATVTPNSSGTVVTITMPGTGSTDASCVTDLNFDTQCPVSFSGSTSAAYVVATNQPAPPNFPVNPCATISLATLSSGTTEDTGGAPYTFCTSGSGGHSFN